jgi:uncharacterized Fe-S radical SAM superfamily protein PflX
MADIIKSSWFCVYDDRIKFNWFSYEYALKLYDYVKESKRLKKWGSVKTDIEIANYCAYFAKRMKQAVADKLSGVTDIVELDEEYIADYWHTNTQRENKVLNEVAGEAWDRLLSVCETCPTRCLSERFLPCELFDRMERGGYFE